MSQLLFLDTFSHEEVDLNLDLVQFPSSVIVEEVRVIPLNGKVHVNFPGGKANMRLGATLPNKFTLEFFVNDLMKPTASTFSSLGVLDYDHHGQICLNITSKRIPTDGLVLRGHYSVVTLAVYGTYTPTTAEQLAMLSSAASSAPPEAELVHQEPPPQPPQPPLTRPPHQVHPIPIAHSPHKRNDWTSSWPAPVPDPLVPNSSSTSTDHYGHNQKNAWAMENGQRGGANNDNFHEHHHPQHHHSHHHHPPPRHHPRHRSPPPRESRSHTRSPPRGRHTTRRSVTPKSPPAPPPPPNNGYSPPPEHHQQQQRKPHHSPASAPNPTTPVAPIPPPQIEEPPILDDMSDISDGDIPEDDFGATADADEDVEMKEEPSDQGEKMNRIDIEEKMNNEEAMEDFGHLSMKAPLVSIPEDIEEISDEEADWSDDGDCFFLDSLVNVEVQFDSDWVDPISHYKLESSSLTSLRTFHLFSSKNQVSESVQENTEESIRKLKNATQEVNCDWVESLEAINTASLTTITDPNDLLPILKRGLSVQEALRHSVHTFKVRHLKSSLKFTTSVLELPMKWSEQSCKAIMTLLMELLLDVSLADPLRVQCLICLHRALDQEAGLCVFLESDWPSALAEFLSSEKKISTRLKVGLSALIQRTALAEAMSKMCQDKFDPEARLSMLRQILVMIKDEDHPKLNFLSNAKCGVVPFIWRDLYNAGFCRQLEHWYSDLKDEALIDDQATLLLKDCLHDLLDRPAGLLLLASFPEQMNKLFSVSDKSFEFARYCLHTLVKIDMLAFEGQCQEHQRTKLENPLVLEIMKDLYGMTFSAHGRQAVIHVLSTSNYLRPIISLANHSGEVDEEQQQKKDLKKSAIRGYACEILLMVVRLSDQTDYLYHFCEELLNLGKSDENSKLFELTSWLQSVAEKENIEWRLEKGICRQPLVSF